MHLVQLKRFMRLDLSNHPTPFLLHCYQSFSSLCIPPEVEITLNQLQGPVTTGMNDDWIKCIFNEI